MLRENRCQERIEMTVPMSRGSCESVFVAGAAFRVILGDSWSAKCCIFSYKMRVQDGTSQVSEAAGAR